MSTEKKTKGDEVAGLKQHQSLVPASAASGAVIGAITGAIGGPPGAVIGGALGAAAGLIAGKVIDSEDQRETAHDAVLDDEIGVTSSELGLGGKKILTVPDEELDLEPDE